MSESDASADDRIRIDIASDVVCPWCVIGYKQLERALAERSLDAEIHWHPFELNPSMPPEGQNLREHIMQKYGRSEADSRGARDRLEEMGAELGFAIRYSDEMRMVNTFRAHQLLHWAGTLGRQTELKLALFAAYFTHHEKIDDPAVLRRVAGEVGLDPDEADAVLRDGRFEEVVRAGERLVTGQGVHGVPAMVFQNHYLVTGAQGTENYLLILDRLTGRGAGPSAPAS